MVQKAKDRNLSKGDGVYLEEHHIIPRSLNGSNEPDNLVMFTAREHYVAHRLLTKMLEGKQKQKMHMALWCMITASDCEKYNSISKSNLYEKIRSEYTTLVSGENHFNYGLIRSDETKEKKLEGLVEGRLTNYITEEYRNKFKVYTTKQWEKIKQSGHSGAGLIKLQ